MNMQVGSKDLTPDQKSAINIAIGQFLQTLTQVAPPLTPHLLSGGIVNIQTMSGMNLKLGFAPQVGGIIQPGGIKPIGF